MALSDRQFQNFVKELEKQRDTLGQEEYNRVIIEARDKAAESNAIKNRSFGKKAGDVAGGLVYGLSAPGRTLQKGVSKVYEVASGGAIKPEVATKEGFEEATGTNLDTTQAKIGEFVGEMAPFAVGSGVTSTAVKGAPLLYRALAQGGTASVVEALNSGDIDKGELYAFLGGVGAEVAGTVVTKMLDDAASKLPDWLVRPLVKQSDKAKAQGKDIVPFLLDSGYTGSVDDIIKQSNAHADTLNGSIQTILGNSDKSINIYSIADDIANTINAGGGKTTADDVMKVISSQAFKSRGVIEGAVANQTDDISIAAANSLRSNLDEALYAGKDYLRAVPPENKAILEMFTNQLRSTVQTLEPQTQSLFKTLSKEITLREALIAKAASGGGKVSLGMYDILTGAGAYSFTGDPVTTGIAVAGRRVAESPSVKTNTAQILKNNIPQISAALSKMSPVLRGALQSLISSVTTGGTKPQK